MIEQSEAIFLLSKEKKGLHLKIYKVNNNNKVIRTFKSTGIEKKKNNNKTDFQLCFEIRW